MFRTSVKTKVEIEQAKELVTRLDNENKLTNFTSLRDWWLFESTERQRKLLLSYVGFDRFTKGFSRPDYDNLIKLEHFNSTNVNKDEVIKLFNRTRQNVLHRLKGRLMESREYRSIDILFSGAMTLRLYNYMTRLGFKRPEELLTLYKAGGIGHNLKDDAEDVLSQSFIEEVIDPNTEALFGEDIDKLPDLVDESKWKYIRVASFLIVPDDVADKLGRHVKMKFDGDLMDLIDKMEDTNKYTSEEISYLRDFVSLGSEAIKMYDITTKRAEELAGDLYSLV